MAYELPPLPYPQDALAPHIEARTMEFHYGKHHATYVANLNKALEGHLEIAAKPIEQVLREISSVPKEIRQAVINNGGGHYHHTFFWQIMGRTRAGSRRGRSPTRSRRSSAASMRSRSSSPRPPWDGLAAAGPGCVRARTGSCTSATRSTRTRRCRRGIRRS